MYYMEKGGLKTLAVIFSCLCVAASLGVGNMTQSNAISLAANQLFSFPCWLSGLLTALAIGLVIIGGNTPHCHCYRIHDSFSVSWLSGLCHTGTDPSGRTGCLKHFT